MSTYADETEQLRGVEDNDCTDEKGCSDFDKSMVNTSSPTSSSSDASKLHFKLDHNQPEKPLEIETSSQSEAKVTDSSGCYSGDIACKSRSDQVPLKQKESASKGVAVQRSRFQNPPKSIFSPVVEVDLSLSWYRK